MKNGYKGMALGAEPKNPSAASRSTVLPSSILPLENCVNPKCRDQRETSIMALFGQRDRTQIRDFGWPVLFV